MRTAHKYCYVDLLGLTTGRALRLLATAEIAEQRDMFEKLGSCVQRLLADQRVRTLAAEAPVLMVRRR
jgi:hypothetical protein